MLWMRLVASGSLAFAGGPQAMLSRRGSALRSPTNRRGAVILTEHLSAPVMAAPPAVSLPVLAWGIS